MSFSPPDSHQSINNKIYYDAATRASSVGFPNLKKLIIYKVTPAVKPEAQSTNTKK